MRKEAKRETRREVRGAQREMDREMRELDRQEKQITMELKQRAKTVSNSKDPALAALAKQLVSVAMMLLPNRIPNVAIAFCKSKRQ